MQQHKSKIQSALSNETQNSKRENDTHITVNTSSNLSVNFSFLKERVDVKSLPAFIQLNKE